MNSLPNIFCITPYSLSLHYGLAINKHVELFPNNSWIVLTDHDAMWLTPNWFRLISNAIVKYQDTDLFTCVTNRLGNPKRCYNDTISKDSDILNHIKIATKLERELGHECEEVTDRIVAGVCMIFPKRVWLDNKFDSNTIIHTEDNKMTSFDVKWTANIKGSIKKILGLYIWHSYRINGQLNDTNHLEI